MVAGDPELRAANQAGVNVTTRRFNTAVVIGDLRWLPGTGRGDRLTSTLIILNWKWVPITSSSGHLSRGPCSDGRDGKGFCFQ